MCIKKKTGPKTPFGPVLQLITRLGLAGPVLIHQKQFLGPIGSSGPKQILGHLGLGLSHTEAQLPLETLAIRVWALDRRLGRERRRVTEAAARGGDAAAHGH